MWTALYLSNIWCIYFLYKRKYSGVKMYMLCQVLCTLCPFFVKWFILVVIKWPIHVLISTSHSVSELKCKNFPLHIHYRRQCDCLSESARGKEMQHNILKRSKFSQSGHISYIVYRAKTSLSVSSRGFTTLLDSTVWLFPIKTVKAQHWKTMNETFLLILSNRICDVIPSPHTVSPWDTVERKPTSYWVEFYVSLLGAGNEHSAQVILSPQCYLQHKHTATTTGSETSYHTRRHVTSITNTQPPLLVQRLHIIHADMLPPHKHTAACDLHLLNTI